MIRKKTSTTFSFLKYLALLSFLMGIAITYISVMGGSFTADYLQYFQSWFSLDLSLIMREKASIFSAIFFSIAYLSSCFLSKFRPVDSYNTSAI